MNILLLNPPYRQRYDNKYERFFVRAGSRWPYSEYKKVREPSIYRPFPFSLAYAAAVLHKRGHTVFALDGVAMQLSRESFVNECKYVPYAVIVCEIAPFSVKDDIQLMHELKLFRPALTVAVGPFVSLLLDHLKGDTGFDFAINGEYELAIKELLDDETKKIKGVYNLKSPAASGPLEHTDTIEPLDRLPAPRWEIFPSNNYPDLNAYWDVFCQLKPAVQIHTSRGCPYRCYFCLWNQVLYKDGKYRTFSAARVVDEMQVLIAKYKAREIYIDDDDFTISKKHVTDICSEMLKRNVNVKWSCMGDAINLDEATVRLMAQSGCIGIKFGVESVDAAVLANVEKPVTMGKIEQLVEWCKTCGIRTHATFSFGLLDETPASMRDTLAFAKKLDIDSVQFSIATPYPGTRFYDTLVQKKMLKDFDWMNYDGSTKCVLSYPQLQSEEIELFFEKAFKSWLLHKITQPAWLLRQARILARTLTSQSFAYNVRFARKVLAKLLH